MLRVWPNDGLRTFANPMIRVDLNKTMVLWFLLLLWNPAPVNGGFPFIPPRGFHPSAFLTDFSLSPREESRLGTSTTTRRVPAASSLLVQTIIPRGGGEAEETSNETDILRIRKPDGSLQRLVLTKEIRSLKVSDLLRKLLVDPSESNVSIEMDGESLADDKFDRLVSELPNLRHGSLLSLTKRMSGIKNQAIAKKKQEKSSFIPFPDLHKKWNDQRFQRRHQKSLTSYNALSDYRDATLHRVDEVSNTPRIQRLDICENIASRFIDSGCKTPVLLLGTIAEQVDRKNRHSLDDRQHPEKTVVAKVHAMVKTDGDMNDHHWKRVAQHLGLRVIGWMVESVVSHETALIPTSSTILQAADWQLKYMQDEEASSFQGFCTVVVNPSSGATEAYQLTDVAVQMASEGLLSASSDTVLKTCYPILMEGRETTELEAVLTLANTAVTSHTGWYSRNKKSSVKSNGRWTKVARSKLLTSLEREDNDAESLEILADFELLVALCSRLKRQEGKEMCETVLAYAKGRTKTTVLSAMIRKRLVQVLSAD